MSRLISPYFLSAALATLATVGYHTLVKKIPATIDPLISVLGIYLFVLLLAGPAILFFLPRADIIQNLKQIGWVQFGIAIVVMGMELGFLLMYRNGWDLSAGNVVTGVFINTILAFIGIAFLREQLNLTNILGVVLCIAGVAMVGWRPEG